MLQDEEIAKILFVRIKKYKFYRVLNIQFALFLSSIYFSYLMLNPYQAPKCPMIYKCFRDFHNKTDFYAYWADEKFGKIIVLHHLK